MPAVKAITLNEPWYARLPQNAAPHSPAALLIESMGQSAGLLALDTLARFTESGGRGERLMLVGTVADVRLGRPVGPGELVVHRVRLPRTVGETLFFER
ncbi:hypothetical protein AB0K35_33925 [Micromonospora sp. NPDC053740]|uniref:hypothetical protein n=1 Tax=Micromonospora sp. NPDC053740 TaxID=3155173 RepID=UPI0034295FA5